MNRKKFLSYSFLGMGSFAFSKSYKAVIQNQRPEAYKAEWVKEFVTAGHSNLDKVREMLANHPNLLNASWDWGGGDFEQAIGGAGHVGNKEIASYLIEKGVRLNVYIMTMMGMTQHVIPLLDEFPSLINGSGPHGFTLHHHAQVGGDNAREILSYLESKGLNKKQRKIY